MFRTRLTPALGLLMGLLLATTGRTATPADFLRADGSRLALGNETVRLRGINMVSVVWPFELPALHAYHSREDFQRLAGWGMNVVRFNLSPVVFEEAEAPFQYRQEGWAWLDQQVAWAKEAGVRLLLSMYVPPGLTDNPEGGIQPIFDDRDLVRQAELQDRLLALWQAIAGRYRDEPWVAGYDLLNEPVTRTKEAWPDLAGRLVTAIRAVDPQHLLVVERTEAILTDGVADPACNRPEDRQFLVADSNVLYDFHFYTPHSYTHQYVFSAGRGDGGRYPSPRVSVLDDGGEWAGAIEGNPGLPAGDSDWRFYQGRIQRADDPRIYCGMPVFACEDNPGAGYFDDFVVVEYDTRRRFVRPVLFADVVQDQDVWDSGMHPDQAWPFPTSTRFWHAWTEGASAQLLTATAGHGLPTALGLGQVTGGCNWHNPQLRFPVRPGFHYQISGWLKGEGSRADGCRLTVEFYRLRPEEAFTPFDRHYLAAALAPWLEFGRRHGVPVNVGELGTTSLTFQAGRGGQAWVRDTIGLFEAHGLHYQYFAYRSPTFGIFRDMPSW
ncbi:MAG: cellulase family glycosylhydrolase [Thermodesulfobacteriota bacterium]